MKRYMTKYAMSTGVEIVDIPDEPPTYGLYRVGHQYLSTKVFFQTEAEAAEDVKKQSRARLESLAKSVAKIRAILEDAEAGKLPMKANC